MSRENPLFSLSPRSRSAAGDLSPPAPSIIFISRHWPTKWADARLEPLWWLLLPLRSQELESSDLLLQLTFLWRSISFPLSALRCSISLSLSRFHKSASKWWNLISKGTKEMFWSFPQPEFKGRWEWTGGASWQFPLCFGSLVHSSEHPCGKFCLGSFPRSRCPRENCDILPNEKARMWIFWHLFLLTLYINISIPVDKRTHERFSFKVP